MESISAIVTIVVCASVLPFLLLVTLALLLRPDPLRIIANMWTFLGFQFAMLILLLYSVFYVGNNELASIAQREQNKQELQNKHDLEMKGMLEQYMKSDQEMRTLLERYMKTDLDLMYRLFSSAINWHNMIESDRLMVDLQSKPKYQDPLKLNRYEMKTFSQFGEDGIIAEIFRRVGTTNKYFVEFGSADGKENNTVCLLCAQGWSGLWMDGDDKAMARAKENFAKEVDEKRLTIMETFITAENIEELFSKNEVPAEFDFLSIDIDGNDYHIWKTLEKYKPRVLAIEYNGIYPPGIDYVTPYRADWVWDQSSSKFGSSLSALESLGRKKGYSLVGCSLAGINAFFVRNDLLKDKFLKPFTAENHYEPPRYWMLFGGHPRLP